MLNLNAIFGSCESIFETRPPKKSASATELQMMEMEINTDLAQAEVDSIKASATMSQLDQLLNMYNHVKRFGVDRTFLSLYNSNNQLNNMLGMKFPSCESINSVGDANSNISKTFIVAMEDSKEGIFAKIIKGIKRVWEKIKYICSVVWNKIKSWLGLGIKRNKIILDKVAEAVRNGAKPKSIKRIITKKRVAATVAVITATIAAIYAYKKHDNRQREEIAKLTSERDKLKTSRDRWKETCKHLRHSDDCWIDSYSKLEKNRDKWKQLYTSKDNELKKVEADLKNARDALARIKQEEKTETIENPTQQQMESIIKDSKDANTQMEKLSGTVDKIEKELETEAKEESYSKFLPAVVDNDPQWLKDSINATKEHDKTVGKEYSWVEREHRDRSRQEYKDLQSQLSEGLNDHYAIMSYWKHRVAYGKQALRESRELLKEFMSLGALNSKQAMVLEVVKMTHRGLKREFANDIKSLRDTKDSIKEGFAYIGAREREHRDLIEGYLNNPNNH